MAVTHAKLSYSNIVAVSLKLNLLHKSDVGTNSSDCLLTAENPSWSDLYSQHLESLTILSLGSLEEIIILSQEKIKLKCYYACWRSDDKNNDNINKPNNYCLFICKEEFNIYGLSYYIVA